MLRIKLSFGYGGMGAPGIELEVDEKGLDHLIMKVQQFLKSHEGQTLKQMLIMTGFERMMKKQQQNQNNNPFPPAGWGVAPGSVNFGPIPGSSKVDNAFEDFLKTIMKQCKDNDFSPLRKEKAPKKSEKEEEDDDLGMAAQ